jgi:hypothetical protein
VKKILEKEGAFAPEDHVKEKRRSLSPERIAPPPLELLPLPKKNSIFWFEWGKKMVPYPARMALFREAPSDGRFYVYFFGSKKVAPFHPSRRKNWGVYMTDSKRQEKAVAEALIYAGTQLDE